MSSPELSERRRPEAIRAITSWFSERPEVTAIALGGSRTRDGIDAWSDYDIYIFATRTIPHEVRRELGARFDPTPEIGNAWFGEGDEWTDCSHGVSADLMHWDRAWFEGQLRDVIERHRPSLGHSTSLWFTAHHAPPLFDREGWFAGIQELAASPYPEDLRQAIIAWNLPLLRTTRSSYRHQIELAIARDDPVSVNHRVAALLASVFDIVFAVTRSLHPGEKRQLEHVARLGDAVPGQFNQLMRELLRSTAETGQSDLVPAIDALCDLVDEITGLT